jgi:hypothetical protein
MTLFGMVTTRSSHHYTDFALKSFFENTPITSNDRFLLVDNDGGYELPNELRTSIEFEVLSAPRSFAENANIFLQEGHATKSAVFLLNNDLIFASGWYEPFRGAQEKILSPLSNRELQLRTDGLSLGVQMKVHQIEHRQDVLKMLMERYMEQAAPEIMRVFTVPFFCSYIGYEVLSELGSLDESFGQAGGEDYDYCIRAVLHDFPVHYAMKSFVFHFGGRSTYAVESPEVQSAREEFFRSRFLEKWGEPLTRLILQEELSVVASKDLSSKIERGSYREVVHELLPENVCPSSKMPFSCMNDGLYSDPHSD